MSHRQAATAWYERILTFMFHTETWYKTQICSGRCIHSTRVSLSRGRADCFHLEVSVEARAIDVCDKDKLDLSRGDRRCHMGKACSKAPPWRVDLGGFSVRSLSVAFSTLRKTLRSNPGETYHLKSHAFLAPDHIIKTSLHNSQSYQARVGQQWLRCSDRLRPQPSHLFEALSGPLTTCRRNEQCLCRRTSSSQPSSMLL